MRNFMRDMIEKHGVVLVVGVLFAAVVLLGVMLTFGVDAPVEEAINL